MKLVATKPFSYNTRRLQAGDVFESKTERDGKLLVAVFKARSIEDRPEEKIPEPKKETLSKFAENKKPESVIETAKEILDEKKNDSEVKELNDKKDAKEDTAEKNKEAPKEVDKTEEKEAPKSTRGRPSGK